VFRGKLSKALFCSMLAFGALGGAYMRPEEIEELMSAMNRPTVAHTLPENWENGDDILRRLLADAEGREDPVEDVIGGGGAGDGVDGA
jgi:hypothetical protein